MCFEAGYEVSHNRIFVYSDDQFGQVIGAAFTEAGAATVTVSAQLESLREQIEEIDFVFLCSYREQRSLVGESGLSDLDSWCAGNGGPGIVHLYGDVDIDYALMRGISVHPPEGGSPMRMSRWSNSALSILRLINASSEPFAGAYSYLGSEKVTIWRAELPDDDGSQWLGFAGQIAEIHREHGWVDVLCADRRLRLMEVEIDGVRQFPAQFIRSIRSCLTNNPSPVQ
ncbi:MAG: hypothetical protein GKR94_04465 [Gammaproteobacteria bacterium]|nr:hypothetical protein [Gammaproteobacteria bacterium]